MIAQTLSLIRKSIFLLLFVSTAIYAKDIEVEAISRSESAFLLGKTPITVEIRDTVLNQKKQLLLDWIIQSAQTVEHYYGRFPVDSLSIKLEVTDGNRVRFGQAFGGSKPFIRVVVGEDADKATLRKDWIMVHEMVHLAMANIPRRHRWWLEGLATYVESIARAQLGHLSEEFVWNGFILRMPQGLPAANDRGLDKTPTWGRTYWGGAVFCLLADIEIRQKSNNQLSLQDALKGVLADGYSMHADTSAMTIFESADKAIEMSVLVPLYKKMRVDPYPVDLDKVWQQLGVSTSNKVVSFDDNAELADIRESFFK